MSKPCFLVSLRVGMPTAKTENNLP
uniref:Uncharacterized protein n=1 Tax=Anguilla anguilla TaxID=7936 RepID=A0A0E9S989_ANGAN